MVHDGIASGFNDPGWVPNFRSTSVKTLICGTSSTSWMVDLDIGELFLNFMLDLDAQKYVDVDVKNLVL